jgi:hypothetical protein
VEILTRLNRKLSGYGVSRLYDGDSEMALYVNRGSMLDITVFYSLKSRKFHISSLYEWKDPA